MKKLFKTAASLTVGCALLSTSAFAALTGTVVPTETGATVKLTGYAEKAQSTILVLKDVDELSADIADSAIAYINQAEATDGTITYDVKVSGDGTYSVFVGGSDQTEAKKLESFTISSVVDVTGVTLAIEGLTADENGNFATELTVGDTLTVNATVAPDNATDKTVTWTSSNADVATVEGGVVTTKAAGDVVITATAGSFSKTVTIKVNEKAPALPEGTAIVAVAAGNAYGAESGNSLVVVSGIASGSVKIKDADGKEVEAYKADYTAAGGDCKYFAIVKGTEFTTADIVYDAEGASTACLFADTDLDTELTAGDVAVALKIAAGTQVAASNRQAIVVDVDADGTFTAGDVAVALKLAAGTLNVPSAVSK